MYNDKEAGQYNEDVEKQRMLNALKNEGFRLDDNIARLAWRIAIDYAPNHQAETDLFKEISNLVRKERNRN